MWFQQERSIFFSHLESRLRWEKSALPRAWERRRKGGWHNPVCNLKRSLWWWCVPPLAPQEEMRFQVLVRRAAGVNNYWSWQPMGAQGFLILSLHLCAYLNLFIMRSLKNKKRLCYQINRMCSPSPEPLWWICPLCDLHDWAQIT
jgi:hypothetical protein